MVNRFDLEKKYDLNHLKKIMSDMDHSLLDEKAVLGLATNRHEGKTKPCFAMLVLLPRGDPIPDDLQYDYEDCVIVHRSVDRKSAMDRINEVVWGQEICMPDRDGMPIKVEGWVGNFVPSMMPWGYTRSTFPWWCYRATMSEGFSSAPYHDALAGGKDNPPYPSLQEALKHVFSLETETNDLGGPSFTIVVPDARARINEVGISGRRIEVEVDDRRSASDGLVVQAFASNSKFTTSLPKIETDGYRYQLDLDGKPNFLMVTLCSSAGEVLDMKRIFLDSRSRNWDPTVTIEDSKDDLQTIIRSGEGIDVEFKSQLNTPHKFIDSVVSFSNGNGGKILVGVDDNGKIVKVEDHRSAIAIIHTWASQYCDPKPLLHAYYSQELKIVVVDVVQGDNKPYFMRDNGCFVRQGGMDVPASRSEVKDMVDKQSKQSRPEVWWGSR
ncbi:MAG: ATP-binding protein [Thaumarchaeota archaeon]|nr:ATP-binding protein [Nitrososphaerota archaeon]